MSDAENGNSESDDPSLAEAGEKAQLNVLGQFIKDLSFENPNAPDSLRGPGENPNLQINVNVSARKLSDDDYEVSIILDANAKNDEWAIYKLEIVYAGVFRIMNVPDQTLQPVLLVNCPSLLFPFLRRIAADLTREGGFPPLLLDPIDFVALYRNNLQQGQVQNDSELIN